ncbi:MAG: methyltransferase domain-containing protein [Deinococcus-Thermus bacterium]|nr:methyltransferase domain-containing protein [Deinococcota bacterium]
MSLAARVRRWRNRLVAAPGFQSRAAANPLTRRATRKDGERLFDLVAGFVHSQVLLALVELDLLADLMDAPRSAGALAARHRIEPQRMTALLRAGAALGLLGESAAGYQTARLGAAATGVPGLADMIRHHAVFYRDLADPLALLRGEADTELARFWPYVFGAEGAVPEDVAARYSELMAESQTLVAEETLRAVRVAGIRRLMDVGGGTGAFLAAVGRAVPGPELVLFDLPEVVPAARARFDAAGLRHRATVVPGSFRADPLPEGADAISLVRVLYDHSDATVTALLAAVRRALPPGGRVIVSEPMTGADRPERAGDAYFAFYCMAMRTGRARAPQEVAGLLREAGFARVVHRRTARPFVTSVVEARAPGAP